MQMLTTEAAQAEIINNDFTSPGTVLPLPSFDQSVQRLPQHSPGKHKQRELPLASAYKDLAYDDQDGRRYEMAVWRPKDFFVFGSF